MRQNHKKPVNRTKTEPSELEVQSELLGKTIKQIPDFTKPELEDKLREELGDLYDAYVNVYNSDYVSLESYLNRRVDINNHNTYVGLIEYIAHRVKLTEKIPLEHHFATKLIELLFKNDYIDLTEENIKLLGLETTADYKQQMIEPSGLDSDSY